MFSIYDGRTEFYQWDKDRKLIVEDNTIKQVHFCNKTDDCSLVCETYTEGELTLVNVPNILLQTDWKIRVYGFTGDYTKHEASFKVNSRTKPADYIYTELEYWTVEKAVTEALEEAKASGAFKGEKGDKGEAGAVKMVVVTELPTIGDADAIYLLPKEESEENNNFSEYVFTNGAWECIGSAGVQVNLDEYVKNTDIAKNKLGLVMIGDYGTHGISINDKNGLIALAEATNQNIDNEAHYKPITPYNLKYAVKVGLTTNQEEWTEEEKKSARELVGAVGATDYASKDTAGIIKVLPGQHGLNVIGETLTIRPANPNEIAAKTDAYKPLTSAQLDYAVKVGMTTNAEEWTEEEKQAARDLVGAVGKKEYPSTPSAGATGTYGVVKLRDGMGISAAFEGALYITKATDDEISTKTNLYKPITPNNLDYAVKVGLTTNTETLTDEEKTNACSWLGATPISKTPSVIYGNNSSGARQDILWAKEATPYSIARRHVGGTLEVGTPTEDAHATNKAYVDVNFLEKKTSDRTSVYAVNAQGEQILVGTSPNATNNGMIPIYNNDGTLHVGTPTKDWNATNKAYVDGLIAELIARIEALEGKE